MNELNELKLDKVQAVFRDIYRILEPLRAGPIDLHGGRVINAGQAIGAFDYVRKFEFDKAIAVASSIGSSAEAITTLLNTPADVRLGLFASRGSAAAHNGEFFVASDHGYVGWISNGSTWNYAFGENMALQAGLAAIAALLTTDDANYRVGVTDFAHTLKWSGTAWVFAPGDSGSGYISMFAIAPPGGVWGICDGTTYSYLKADGTTANFVTPNYGTAAYLKLGTSATIGPTAASGTSGSSGGSTDSAMTGITENFSGATAGADNFVDSISDPGHTHTLSSHDHGPGTLELRNTLLIGYFRR